MIGGGWRRLVVGNWWLMGVGGWQLAVGSGWRLVAVGGGWQFEVDGPWGRSLSAVLSKKKIGFLKDPPGSRLPAASLVMSLAHKREGEAAAEAQSRGHPTLRGLCGLPLESTSPEEEGH